MLAASALPVAEDLPVSGYARAGVNPRSRAAAAGMLVLGAQDEDVFEVIPEHADPLEAVQAALDELLHHAKKKSLPPQVLQRRFQSLQNQIQPLGLTSAEIHRSLLEASDLVRTASRQRPVHITAEDEDSVIRGSPFVQDAQGIGTSQSSLTPQRSADEASAPSDHVEDPAPSAQPPSAPARYRMQAGAMREEAQPPSVTAAAAAASATAGAGQPSVSSQTKTAVQWVCEAICCACGAPV